jgi:hypothetical protein
MVPWLVDDPEPAIAALVEIGQPSEDALLKFKVLREKNAKARKNAARVLEQIGTAKSVGQLAAAAKDPRDSDAAVAAQVALDAVRARVADAKSSATTKSSKP